MALFLTNNHGLDAILEKIFLNLDFPTLKTCYNLNFYWKSVIESPHFLLKKCKREQMPESIYKIWKDLSQRVGENPILKNAVSRCIMDCLKSGSFHSPVYKASKLGFLELLQFQHDYHQNNFRDENLDKYPFQSSFEGAHPMHLACSNGHLEILKFWIRFGCDINMTNSRNGWKPIHYAIKNGHLDILKYLCDNFDDLDMRSRIGDFGLTPFLLAVRVGHLDIVKFLVANPNSYIGAKTSSHGLTAFHLAVLFDHLEVVEFLTTKTKSPDVKDANGFSPIEYAQVQGQYEMVEIIKATGYSTLPPISRLKHKYLKNFIANFQNSLKMF